MYKGFGLINLFHSRIVQMTPTKARTSVSHPLTINTISVSNREPGLTFCPGKKQANTMTGSWDRDLALDVESVNAWGATPVISLLEEFEYDELAVRNLPIPDKCAPDKAWLIHWLTLRHELKTLLTNSRKILIRCKGGFGRTCTVAALILMDHGHTAVDAIAACRQAREFAVETDAQEKFVMAYEPIKLS